LIFEVIPSGFPEDLDKETFSSGAQYSIATSTKKAKEILERFSKYAKEGHERIPDLIIAADTVVVLEGEILEKPQNAQHAESMLLSLSGKQHLVYTGVCLLFPEGTELVPNGLSKLHTFSEETLVTFSTLSSEMIASYVASGIPL